MEKTFDYVDVDVYNGRDKLNCSCAMYYRVRLIMNEVAEKIEESDDALEEYLESLGISGRSSFSDHIKKEIFTHLFNAEGAAYGIRMTMPLVRIPGNVDHRDLYVVYIK